MHLLCTDNSINDVHYIIHVYNALCIYNTIISIDDNVNNILIVGHNPGLTAFAQEYMQLDTMHLGTSGIISCSYDTNSWTEFALNTAKRNFVTSPK